MDVEDLGRRIEDLTQEVRRQGRAAIGAQAAAQACLERLSELRTNAAPAPEAPADRAWLEALLPPLDALQRATAALASRAAPSRRGSFGARWLFGSRAPSDEIGALGEGLRLVVEQFDEALAQLGVEIIEPAAGAVDPHRHRVVEVRSDRGRPPGHVLELVRRGYACRGVVVREAEVIANQAQAQHRR
jgi:molecular chaperone GrpE (heat shock protein)